MIASRRKELWFVQENHATAMVWSSGRLSWNQNWKLELYSESRIGSLQDPLTWYEINYAGTQVAQWDNPNKGKSGGLVRVSLFWKSPRYLRASIIYSIPCDRIVLKGSFKLQNLQILKKLFKKPSPFLSSEQSCGPKARTFALNITGVRKYALKTCRCGQHWKPFDSSFEWNDIWYFCPPWFEILKLVWYSVGDTFNIASIQLAVSCSKLYFVLCCALKRTGKFASENNAICLF